MTPISQTTIDEHDEADIQTYKQDRARKAFDYISSDLNNQLQPLIEKSKELQLLIQESKTNAKKALYKKKLKKNNIKVMHILIQLENNMLLKQKYNEQKREIEDPDNGTEA